MTTGGAQIRRATRAALVVGAAIATGGAVIGGPLSQWAVAVVQNVLVVALLASATSGLRRSRTVEWWCIEIYAATFVVAQVGWTVLGFASGPTPLLVWPDWVYGAAVPIGMAGLAVLSFGGLRRREVVRVLTDAVVVALGLATASWAVFGVLSGADRTVSNPATLLFPALDVLAGAVLLTAAIYQPHRRQLAWVAAAVPFAAVSDTIVATVDHARHHAPLTSAALGLAWYAVPALLLVAMGTNDVGPSTFPLDHRRRRSVTVFAAIGLAGILLDALQTQALTGPTLWLAIGLGAATSLNQWSVFTELQRVLAAHGSALTALGAREEELRLTLEGAPVGIIVFEDSVMLSANPTAVAMLGIGGLEGTPARDFVGFDVVPELLPESWSRASDTIETTHHDFQWPGPDGSMRWMHLSLARNPERGDHRVIATVEDVTDRTAVTDRLSHLASHDPLTGLPNRVAFLASLDEALSTATEAVAVAFLDLDRFKVINDSVGHVTGDRVLEAVTARLLAAVGDDGTVARLSGDEFTILVVDHDRAHVVALIERVQLALGEPLVLGEGIETYPTASVGVAFATADEPAEALMARADAAMYRAKERGRNTYELYDDSFEPTAHAELRLVGELHRAIEREEFRVFYQPVVDARTTEVVGYEALVRWQHPQRGLLTPGEFIDAAEASGLIVPIGEWVLREALGQLATWHRTRPHEQLSMSVNLAARQVNESLPGTVTAILTETGADPERVWLELTESALMFDSRNAETVLGQVRALGVHVSVDDFGTGYSSLTYLQRLPIEGIKIDQTFVAGLGRRSRDDAICHAVSSLGSALGLRTVAEGVETAVQRDRLRAMGCAHLQGYLFGVPEPATAIDARLAATRVDRGPVGRAWSTSGPTSANATR
jgi:diguanylate cyclase (GGDEF)-like protein/PAS domain S-box-containing protein